MYLLRNCARESPQDQRLLPVCIAIQKPTIAKECTPNGSDGLACFGIQYGNLLEAGVDSLHGGVRTLAQKKSATLAVNASP